MISLGHDEYWSPVMRAALTRARDRGTNVAFLGANAIYRKIRFGRTGLGADRLEINYKDDTDPIGRTDPAQVTTQWREPPSSDNESSLTGTDYGCSPVRAPMVVVDPGSWLFTGLGLPPAAGCPAWSAPSTTGSTWPRRPRGRSRCSTHSPLVCDGRADAADAAYYTTRSGAGVFDSGTSDWVAGLDSPTPVVRQVVTAVTTRLLAAFAIGPAGRAHPARDTAPRYRVAGRGCAPRRAGQASRPVDLPRRRPRARGSSRADGLDLRGDLPVDVHGRHVRADRPRARPPRPARARAVPARRSIAWAAQSSSTARTVDTFASTSPALRAACQPIETWSSWLPLVGMLSTPAGWASTLFSATSDAAVYWASMKPELVPALRARNGGRPREVAGSSSR